MAGDWIKMRIDLRKDPAVKRMARGLSINRFEVIGRLHAVWSWADQQLRDGNALGVTAADLDEEAELPGFAESMADAGWLKILSTGIVFVDFDKHNGKPAKERALTSKRVKRHRDGISVTPQLPEKRREDLNKHPTVANSTAPDPAPQTPVKSSNSKPRARMSSEARTQALLAEQRVAAEQAAPPPPALAKELAKAAERTARMAAHLEEDRARESSPVVEEPPAPDPAVAAQAGAAEPEDGEFEVEWWNDSDLIVMRGSEEGVRVVPGQEFEEFTARVLAAAGPGPWMEAQDVDMRQRVAHWTAVGVNPASPQQAQRPAAQQRRG